MTKQGTGSTEFCFMLKDFLHLFYPLLCEACSRPLYKGEEVICTHCLAALSYTNFHRQPENPVARFFWGRVPLRRATSYLYFRKGTRVQKLMHNLKYKGSREVGVYMGRMFARSVMPAEWLDRTDLILPVPLHPLKQKRRGYNQSSLFAEGISAVSGIAHRESGLVRNIFTETQTRKSRISRWENVEQVFRLYRPDDVEGKHVLLVDDIVTTGATLEACAHVLLTGGAASVSVATIAFTV